MEPIYLKYKKQAISMDIIKAEEIKDLEDQFYAKLKQKYMDSKIKKFNLNTWKAKAWE